MSLPLYPDINGNRFEWASVEIRVALLKMLGVKSLSFSQELEPGQVYGAHAQKLGRTRGELKEEGSLEMFKEEADELLRVLGPGYMEKVFDVVANYREGVRVSTIVLSGCRIKKIDDSHNQGTDALTTKFDLDVTVITRNGAAALINPLGAPLQS